ncbi:MAG: hypothetical protein JWO78_926 [Micavibrio sp.]|nr:hypothetical protein [Micavibrio sp.]
MGLLERATKRAAEIAAQLKAKTEELAPGALDKAKALGQEALDKTQTLAAEGLAAAEKLKEKAEFGYAIDTIISNDGSVNPKYKAMHENALVAVPGYKEQFNTLVALYAAKPTAPKPTADRKTEDALRETVDSGVAAVGAAADKFKAHKALVDLVIK